MTAHTVCTTYVYESGLSSLNNPELQTTMRDFKDQMGKKDEVHHSLALLYVVLSLLSNVVFQTVLWQLFGRTSRCGKTAFMY